MGEGKLFSIRVIELIVNVYDIITLPLYYAIQQPWKARQLATQVRSRKVGDHTWVNLDDKLDKSGRTSVDTLDQLFRDSVATYATKDCLGVRKVLAVQYKDDTNSVAHQNGIADGNQRQSSTTTRAISKYVLDDKYTWYTYAQIEKIVINLSAGLVNLCGESLMNSDGTRKLLICADTCMEWFLMAHACFRNNITVVTAYTTLDNDAILHTILQTEVRILVVSQKFASRVPDIAKLAPLVETVIILDEPLPGCPDERLALKDLLSHQSSIKQIISYGDIVNRGSETKESILGVPTAKDIAVLMYTSGSTGKAKGVMLSHDNIVYTSMAFSGPDVSHNDRYIGYLPLGHVLELAAECIFLRNGSTIAYSSPMTLTNNSPMIMKGQYGDTHIFRPTMMGAVPLVLDRVRNGLQQAIKSQGKFYDQLINDFVIRYKRYWWQRYYETPLMNFFICRKFNAVLGGRIRAICSGGAALSRDTHEYLRFVTNYTVMQGYGLTETSAAASFCDIHDRRCNIVGAPYPTIRLRLESWSDYSVDDSPYPRGEIIVGGQPVARGYYKMDELTRESFFEEDGIRYFRTGDIGMMLPDGCLKIIDRKKDIVKPLSGEYISLSEIENTLRTVPIIENILVYCSQYSNYIVALVKPEIRELRVEAKQLFNESNPSANKFRESIWKATLAKATGARAENATLNSGNNNNNNTNELTVTLQTNGLKASVAQTNELANGYTNVDVAGANDSKLSQLSGKSMNADILEELSDEVLCANQWLVERVLRIVKEEGSKKKLKRTQIPSKIKLVCDEWSPESGLVSASFKLRRREIERLYAEDIKQLYAELGQKIDQGS